jgi:multidrug efflux pump subunit AcrB
MAYIRINRKLFSNQLWKEHRVFSRAEAWIDLIQLASFTFKNKRIIDGARVEWGRGQYPISYSFLANKWMWSIHKVRTFLKMLLNEKQIMLDFTGRTTLITLCNYDFYNPISQGDGMGEGTANGTVTAQDTAQQAAQITSIDTNEYTDDSQDGGISGGTTNGKKAAVNIITNQKDKEDREEKEKINKKENPNPNPNPEERENKNIKPIDPKMQEYEEKARLWNLEEERTQPDPERRTHWTAERVKHDEEYTAETIRFIEASEARQAERKKAGLDRELPSFEVWTAQEKAKSKKKNNNQDNDEIL